MVEHKFRNACEMGSEVFNSDSFSYIDRVLQKTSHIKSKHRHSKDLQILALVRFSMPGVKILSISK